MNAELATTRKLAAFAATLVYQDMPAPTVAMAKRLLLDGIGCMLVGAKGKPARSAAAMVRSLGGNPQATMLSDNSRCSVRDAAFVNGISLYSVGLNDIHKPAGAHPAGCVIPVLLAIGEWHGVAGTKLLAAMAAGYETLARIGRTMIPSHRERGFHPTGTCGTFGAAAAAGNLLGLDAEQLACAFGIAGSQATGLYECHHDGTQTMIFHAGRAAQNGVEAVLLTQAGLTGPATVLEGSKGFFRAVSNVFDAETAMRDLGQRFELDMTSFRPYFGCNSTIAASGAAAQIIRRGGRIEPLNVEQITVHCHAVVARDNSDTAPHNLAAARLSLPFNLAMVLVNGDVLTTELEEQSVWNPEIRHLLPRVRLVSDASLSRYGSRVVIRFLDGRTEEESILDPRGSPTNPLTWADIVEKFQRLVSKHVPEADQIRLIDAIDDIESTDGAKLMSILRSAASTEGAH